MYNLILNFLEQISGCSMGGPLRVIPADIRMVTSENAIARPLNTGFYKPFVDDIYTKRSKNT